MNLNLLKKVRDIDSKYLIGTIAGLLLSAWGVYLAIRDVSPDVVYRIVSFTSVYDVKEDVSDLKIIFRGDNLIDKSMDLSVVSMDVLNQGNERILPNYFDPSAPWGVAVRNAILVETPAIVSATNTYLMDHLTIEMRDSESAVFSLSILEPGQSFRIKILILHSKQTQPEILSIGKIAGVDSINVVDSSSVVDDVDLFERALGGGILVNIVRIVSLLISVFIFTSVVVFVAAYAQNIPGKRRRRKHAESFSEFYDQAKNPRLAGVFDRYIEHGSREMHSLKELIGDSELINYTDKNGRHPLINTLLKEELASEVDGSIVIDSGVSNVISEFSTYVRSKGEIKRGGFYVQTESGKSVPADSLQLVEMVDSRIAPADESSNKSKN